MTDIHEALAEITATVVAKPRVGRDPVNQPMVNSWVEAIGDTNPIYRDEDAARAVGHPGIVAPPAMIQVWTMFGLAGERPKDDPMGPIMKLFDDAGYVGVVATNCEQTYHRYLQPGEHVSISVADHPRLRRTYAERLGRVEEHPGGGLAAIAGRFHFVGTVKRSINDGSSLPE